MKKHFHTENIILALAYGLIHLIHNLRSPKEYIYSLAKAAVYVYTVGYTAGIHFHRTKSFLQERIHGV